MKLNWKNQNFTATILALMLAVILTVAAAPSGLLAAANSALETYGSATEPVYETPVTPPPVTDTSSSTDSVYGSVPPISRSGSVSGSGNNSTGPIAAVVDETPPQLSGFFPTDGSLIGPTATFGASFFDPEPSSGIKPSTVMIHIDDRHQFGCSITDSSISCTKSGLSDGSHKVEAFACDNNIKCSSNVWHVTVDALAPVISGNQPTGTINTSAATVVATFSDSGSGVDPASATLTVDGAAVACLAQETGISCPLTGLGESSHAVHLEVSDRLGNRATQDWSFSLDTAAIGVTGQSPADGAWQNSPSPNVTVEFVKADTAEIDPSQVTLLVDGVDVSASADCQVTGLSYTPLSPRLADGWHTVSVTVHDNAGHTGTSSWTFGVDATPPDIVGASPTGATDAKPTLIANYSDAGSGVDPQSASIIVDGQELTNSATILPDSISYTPVEALAPGSHNVQLSVCDLVGNQQTTAWNFSTNQAPQTTPANTSSPVIIPVTTTGSQPSVSEYWMNDGPIAIFSGGGGAWSISGFLATANAYYLPWFDTGTDSGHPADEVLLKNTGAGEAIVNIFVGGERRWEGKVAEGGTETATMPGITGGPVRIMCPSGQALEVTHRIKNADDMMTDIPAIPEENLESELLLPRYEALPARQGSSSLIIANAGQQEAAVDVYVGDPSLPESLKGNFTIAANAAARADLPGVTGGPVRIICTNGQPLLASIETGHGASGQEHRSVTQATGRSRLETMFTMDRDEDQNVGNHFNRIFIANPNDLDLSIELKIAGEPVSELEDIGDGGVLTISRQDVRTIDLAGLPAGQIEIDCPDCSLNEGLLASFSD